MTGQIGFNNIPGSGLVAPLLAFEFNSGGQPDGQMTAYIIGHATGSATMASLTPTPVASQNDVDLYAGGGSMIREMYRVFSANAPVQPVKILSLPADGTAEQRTLTFVVAANSSGVGVILIEGEQIEITVLPTDTATTVAANVVAAINTYYNPLTNAMLPLTATSAAGVVTVTMRHAGALGADVDIYVPSMFAGNLFAVAGALTVDVTVAGTGIPNVAAALAAIGEDPAQFVVAPWSDATSLAAYTAWASDINGRWAFNRLQFTHVWCCADGNFATLTTLGVGLNDRHTSIVPRNGMPRAPWLVVAAYCGRHAPWLADGVTGNVSRNQTGNVIQGLEPPRDRTTWFNYTARNTLNSTSISTWSVGPGGVVQIDKAVTTYQFGTSGQPDTVFRDVQRMYQLIVGFTYIIAVLQQEQGQKAFATSNPGNLAAISTPNDIAATFLSAYNTTCMRGIFQNLDAFAAGLIVQPNAENPARCDVGAPFTGLNPLDIIATNSQIYSVAPAS